MRTAIRPFSFGEPIAEINTTPMIDVMLVLLVMLILTLPKPTHKIAVELPGAGSSLGVPPPVHNLTLNSAGASSWDGAAISSSDLTARLRALAVDPAKPLLQMRTDAETPYVRFDETLAQIKRAGVTQIGFVGNEAFRAL
jgi:biopolymer transport protein ExbD